jgi:uncharacterized protein YecT (DUF1311 family)
VRTFGFALLAMLAAAVPAAAEDDIDCNKALGQQDMNLCAEKDFEAADAELNTVWKEARKTAKAMDAEQRDELKGADKALLAAQRGWIAYRDAQCELAGFEARGGSMEPMLVSGCMAELTRARTRQLKEFAGGSAQ